MNPIQSETIGKLAEALAKAQGKFKTAVKDKKNPHFKSSYASYESVRDACQGALSAESISITHQMDLQEGKRVMITQLTHISGEWIRSYLALPADKETPQGVGSSITYAMRYSLSSILCIPSGDGDDDGEVAEAPHREPIISKTLSTSQLKVIEGLIGEDIEFLNNILKVNRKLSLKDIPADQFDIIMEALRNR